MSSDNKRKEVETLVDKAAKAEKSEDALRFSQAACNVANAMITVVNMESSNTSNRTEKKKAQFNLDNSGKG